MQKNYLKNHETNFYHLIYIIMGYKNAVASNHDGNQSKLVSKVAGNNLDASKGTLLSLTSGFVVAANTTTAIIGTSVTEKVFAADNQTVAKDKVTYLPADARTLYTITTSAAIAQADVGKYYSLTAAQLVDVATASATQGANSQVRLEAITGSTTVWVFSIVLR